MTSSPIGRDSKDQFAYANQIGDGVIEVKVDSRIHEVSVSWVKKIVAETLKLEKERGRSVSILLTDDRQIRKLNKRFLGHDYATDVISFGSDHKTQLVGEADHLGDLVVSAQMAKSTAKALRISLREELGRYLVHGTLHLLGYDDKRPADKNRMFKRQEQILSVILK